MKKTRNSGPKSGREHEGVVRRKDRPRQTLPPDIDRLARGEVDYLPAKRGVARIEDSREAALVPGVTNRDARALCDDFVEQIRKAYQRGGAAAPRLPRLMATAARLALWRGRSVTGFQSFAEDLLQISYDEALELAERGRQEMGLAEADASEAEVALWMRSLAALRSGDVHAEVWVQRAEDGRLRISVEARWPVEALVQISRRLSSIEVARPGRPARESRAAEDLPRGERGPGKRERGERGPRELRRGEGESRRPAWSAERGDVEQEARTREDFGEEERHELPPEPLADPKPQEVSEAAFADEAPTLFDGDADEAPTLFDGDEDGGPEPQESPPSQGDLFDLVGREEEATPAREERRFDERSSVDARKPGSGERGHHPAERKHRDERERGHHPAEREGRDGRTGTQGPRARDDAGGLRRPRGPKPRFGDERRQDSGPSRGRPGPRAAVDSRRDEPFRGKKRKPFPEGQGGRPFADDRRRPPQQGPRDAQPGGRGPFSGRSSGGPRGAGNAPHPGSRAPADFGRDDRRGPKGHGGGAGKEGAALPSWRSAKREKNAPWRENEGRGNDRRPPRGGKR